MTTHKFSKLRNKMSPARRKRNDERAQKLLAHIDEDAHVKKHIELSHEHASALLLFLHSCLDDMRIDEEFINEESPHLMEGMRALIKELTK